MSWKARAGTIQHWMQRLLKEEVIRFLGWGESRRTAVVDRGTGCRNRFGKARRFSMSNGTIEVRRPRMHGLGSDSSAEYCRRFGVGRSKLVGSCLSSTGIVCPKETLSLRFAGSWAMARRCRGLRSSDCAASAADWWATIRTPQDSRIAGDPHVSFARFAPPHRQPKPITHRPILQISYGLHSRGGSSAGVLAPDSTWLIGGGSSFDSLSQAA